MIYEKLFENLKLKLRVGDDIDACKNEYIKVCNVVVDKKIDLSLFFAEASILSNAQNESHKRNKRNDIKYIIPTKRNIRTLFYTENAKGVIDPDKVRICIVQANIALERIHDLSLIYGVEIFQLLGLRNLSAFVGQVMVKALRRNHNDELMENPNQDGYPDLCALTPDGLNYIRTKASDKNGIKPDKELWSPYPFGGIEVKATCGNTPAATIIAKPLIGESRYPIMKKAEWKAHHQGTKILLGVYWDFIDGLPTILAAFFRNNLDIRAGCQ